MAIYKELTKAEVNEILYNSSNNEAEIEALCYFDEKEVKHVYYTASEIKDIQENNKEA